MGHADALLVFGERQLQAQCDGDNAAHASVAVAITPLVQ